MPGQRFNRFALAIFWCFAMMLSIAAPLLAQGTQSPAANSNTTPATQ